MIYVTSLYAVMPIQSRNDCVSVDLLINIMAFIWFIFSIYLYLLLVQKEWKKTHTENFNNKIEWKHLSNDTVWRAFYSSTEVRVVHFNQFTLLHINLDQPFQRHIYTHKCVDTMANIVIVTLQIGFMLVKYTNLNGKCWLILRIKIWINWNLWINLKSFFFFLFEKMIWNSYLWICWKYLAPTKSQLYWK